MRDIEDISVAKACAEAGDASAQLVVGLCYRNGFGVERDSRVGLFWLERAATQGIPLAQFLVGNAFEIGADVPQNPEVAFSWMKRAAESGFVLALERLALYHEQGFGTTTSPANAQYAREQASKLGSRESHHRLGDEAVSIQGAASTLSFKHYVEAASRGDAEAAFKVARIYETGGIVPPNNELALEYYERSSNLGFWYANNYLAHIYEKGLLGLEPNAAKAKEYMNRSTSAFSRLRAEIENFVTSEKTP